MVYPSHKQAGSFRDTQKVPEGESLETLLWVVQMKGIIFSTDMIKAILEGRKTQTRRVMKPQPPKPLIHRTVRGRPDLEYWYWADEENETIHPVECPSGQVGDRLWVRETFCKECYGKDAIEDACYKEDLERHKHSCVLCRWTSSRFMPRWASRITLEITDIRAERLQEIPTDDCFREGLPKHHFGFDFTFSLERYVMLEDFKKLWDSLNAKRGYGWEVNPWVWVISFRVVRTTY